MYLKVVRWPSGTKLKELLDVCVAEGHALTLFAYINLRYIKLMWYMTVEMYFIRYLNKPSPSLPPSLTYS